MISMETKTSVALAASVTASLISKLSLRNEEVLVDLGNLWCPKSGFVAQRFYLVGRLNTTRAVVFNAFRSVVHSMWRLPTLMEVQARGDRFLLTFASERHVNQVEIQGLLAALSTTATARLVAETIGFVLQVDRGGFQHGIARGRLTLPLHQPVRLERRIRVSPVDVIQVFSRYGRLLRHCPLPPLSALFPKEKRPTQIRAVPKFSSPAKIAEVRRDRDEEEPTDGKHARHALALVPLPLNPKETRFTISDGGAP
ncbi:hypothetical protein ACLB2K_022472 [Fragaria x ananassa]